eukprot:246736_1
MGKMCSTCSDSPSMEGHAHRRRLLHINSKIRETNAKLQIANEDSRINLLFDDPSFEDRCKTVGAYMHHIEVSHPIIPHCIYHVISSFYIPRPDPEGSLFEDLARFLRTLPPKSKRHIWEHGIRIKTADGRKVCEQTKNKEQINTLLCDCVIVYVKYLDR